MAMRVTTLASGAGWRVHDVECSAGPGDPAFEEQHDSVCIAAVMQGSFQYRTTQGTATLAPGAVLLGNHGHCFECGHQHARGDRCLSFLFEPGFFETILSESGPGRWSGFALARVPPVGALSPILTAAELALDDPERLGEVALEVAGAVVSVVAGSERATGVASGRDEQRIAGALRRIEMRADEDLSLAVLAREAAMSRYHFLRVFRQVVGLTPHQFILRTRLHRAAVELRRTRRTVLDVALEAGFSDLSTFNRRFRATMGVTPSGYRRLG